MENVAVACVLFSATGTEVVAAAPGLGVAIVLVVVTGVLGAAGLLTPGAGALVKELRHALGAGVPLMAPDDFALVDALRALAGPAAQGLYISQWGIPNSHLPPAGKTLLRNLAVTSPASVIPDFAASYGAQGAEILLDAIARSDGSRASVTKELFRTNVRDGILGDIRFTRQGDLVVAPLTIFRVRGDELVVDRVVTVPSTQPKS